MVDIYLDFFPLSWANPRLTSRAVMKSLTVIALSNLVASTALVYLSFSPSVPSIRVPTSSVPTPTIKFELPPSTTTVSTIITENLLGHDLWLWSSASVLLSWLMFLHLSTTTLLFHRLLLQDFPYSLNGVKAALMMSLTSLVASHQTRAVYTALSTTPGGNDARVTLEYMIYIACRLRWLLLGVVQGILGFASASHFVGPDGLPTRVMEIPIFLGSSSLMLPTLLMSCSLLTIVATVVPNAEVFLGLAFNVYRVSAVVGGGTIFG